MTTLSTRGQKYQETPEWFIPLVTCIANANKETGEDGKKLVNLGVASNVLCHELVEEEIKKIRSEKLIDRTSFNYFQFEGMEVFRSALCKFFNEYLITTPTKAEPDNFAIGNGVGPMLEVVISSLANEGDYILVPAPMYHAFTIDLGKRIGCIIKPVPLKLNEDMKMELELEAVKLAYEECMAEGKKPPVFLNVNPHNPSGAIFSAGEVKQIISWCVENEIHFVSDEIYALSIFNTADTEFVSAYNLSLGVDMEGSENYVHVLWGFSKDLGMNGMRVGTVCTKNKDLLQSLQALAYFFCIPADIQQLGAAILSDDDFMSNYVVENKKRLTEAYDAVVKVLQENNVKDIVRSEAGMFVYFKLSDSVSNKDEEKELWLKVANEKKVMALPSFVFDDSRFGWFRLCFTAYDLNTTIEAVKRFFD